MGATVIEHTKKYTFHGILSILFGVLAFVTTYNWGGMLLWCFLPFSFGLLAVIMGIIAQKKGDGLWKIGFLVGSVSFVIGIFGFLVLLLYLFSV